MTKKISNNKRSMDALREAGWECDIVERWIPHTFITKDLFGFADILAMHHRAGFLAVQTTSFANMNARMKKIKEESRATLFLMAGGRIVVHGWKKNGKRSDAPGQWVCKRAYYELPKARSNKPNKATGKWKE